MNEMADATPVELSLLRQAVQEGIPINGSLELLPLCNMDCDMCYVRLSKEEMEKRGQLRTITEWLSLAHEMKTAGTLFLLLTGGEPLLYHDFRTLYTELRSLGMILTVNTNGTLLDEDWADFFAAWKPRRINLTLYGTDADTYEQLCHYRKGYEKTIHAIHLLKERGIDLKVGCSAVPKNETDTEKIFALGEELSVPIHIDSYMYPATRERASEYDKTARLEPEEAASIWFQDLKHAMSVSNYKIYREQLLRTAEQLRIRAESPAQEIFGTQCMAGNCSFTINWQGEMRPCVMLSSPSAPVFQTGFQKAWKQLQTKLKTLHINSKCNTCYLRPFCHICPASALYESGSYDGIPDYICKLAEASYQLLKGDSANEINEPDKDF